MNENKFKICNELVNVIKLTEAGADVVGIQYDDDEEVAVIIYNNGYVKPVNVAMDSGIALIKDIVKSIN